MPENPKQEVAYLRIKKPPEGWTPPTTIWFYLESAAKYMRIEVLGPPVPALPEPLSPEARALLESAKYWHKTGDGHTLFHAARSYVAALTPPDPLREAREALADLRQIIRPGDAPGAIGTMTRLSAALDRLAEKGGAP